jgi:hypothetical protein
MGSGYRTFTAGEVLTASNVQNFLQNQSVMVFADSTARATSIGTANFEEGMVSYLENSDTVEVYNGATWGSIAPTSTQGLTLINTTSFSGVSSHSLTQDTFSSSYKDYRLVYKITTTQSSNITYRFRTAGSDNSTSNYQYQNFTAIGGSVSASNDTGTSIAITSTGGAITQFFTMDLFRPQIAENTIFYQNNILNLQGSSPNIRFYYGQFGATTIFDSGTIITSAGTLSGSVSVYGYTT